MMSRKRTGKGQITLARALSKFGVASRKQSADLIREGRVGVNTRIVRSPDLWVDPKKDKLTVDGKSLRREKLVYFVMNKPTGVVTTRSDELGRKTVYGLLPDDSRWLFPVGRLDKDTSGLLLFTNDTRFGDKVTNPLSKVPKTYAVELDGPLSPEALGRMESIFELDDGTVLKPAKVKIDRNSSRSFHITIVEGKNRQIRRVCEELGYEVRRLCRLSIGPIRLGSLREGEIRPLTEAERLSVVSPIPDHPSKS
jgi:23S rRNA pseudouridine2605 synthase